MTKLVHRDDYDDDFIKKLEEAFGEKIVFAGDMPGGPDETMQAMMEAINKANEKSLAEGSCIDCGEQMPDYHPDQEDWKPTKGWRWFSEHSLERDGEIVAWQCPKCDVVEEGQ